jgi:hypoxanthine phosphoribosyltransferase
LTPGNGLRRRYTEEQIRRKVSAIARRIDRAYADAGSGLLLVGVLKGSLFFLADLAREITVPAVIDFVRMSSYRGGTSPRGKALLSQDIEADAAGKHVLVVEEIVDTGRTVRALRRHFERKGPRSVRFCALVDKRSRREADTAIEFPGFRAGSGFLVGYGMDYGELGRELPQIYELTRRKDVTPRSGGRE